MIVESLERAPATSLFIHVVCQSSSVGVSRSGTRRSKICGQSDSKHSSVLLTSHLVQRVSRRHIARTPHLIFDVRTHNNIKRMRTSTCSHPRLPQSAPFEVLLVLLFFLCFKGLPLFFQGISPRVFNSNVQCNWSPVYTFRENATFISE